VKAVLTLWGVLRSSGAFWACVGVISAIPTAFAYADYRESKGFKNGEKAGRDALLAQTYAIERQSIKERLAAERKADAAVTNTRHAEAKATEASAKAATASARLRAAIGKVDTVRDTVITEVVRESAALIVAVDTLTKAVDSLNATVRAERAAHAALVLTWKAADDAQRIVFASVNARLAKAERRPTRTMQVVTAFGTGVAVALTCKAVPQC
jgi:hypothetical protein